MHRDLARATLLIAASAAAGWVAWNGNVLLLPVAAAFPAVWSLARTRWQAAAVSAAYFLAASRGLPQGVANFYSTDVWPGLLLWLMASIAFVIVHSALWTSRARLQKPIRYLVVCLVMAVPPFGIMGWAHPITAAGVVFSGRGWWGLAAMAAGLALMTTRHRPAAAMAMTGLWLWSAAEWTTPNPDRSWRGVDLQFGASLGRDTSLARQEAIVELVRRHPSGTTAVLPESAMGFLTPTVSRFWQANLAEAGITVIAGAAIVDEGGYDNVLVRISAAGSDVLYRERMPVPGSMWQPWLAFTGEDGGARAHIIGAAVASDEDITIAPLICYEQLLVWPVLQSVLHHPDVIVAVGNGWWTAGTSIVEIQRASTEAWARLFNLPLVLSFNT